MRVLHTSDWHLGKKLFKAQRLPEQELFLEWLIETIKKQKVDVLIVAGDIFDVPNPPNSALTLFFDFIYKLKEYKELHIIMIGGNHDSNSLLKAPKPFFKDQNCHIRVSLPENTEESDIFVTKGSETLAFKTLPYFRNFELLNQTTNTDGEDDQIRAKNYFQSYFKNWAKPLQKNTKRFLIAHHVFGNYEMSGSEHAIYLSGLEHFPLSWVQEHFDYIALGHIHKKMALSENPPILYPGSPIPMRFSEKSSKYVSLVVTSEKEVSYELVEIPKFRAIVQLKTNINDYRAELEKLIQKHKDDKLPPYLEIAIALDAPHKGLADNIRGLLKGSNIELLSYIPQLKKERKNVEDSQTPSELSINQLFDKYYKEKFSTDSIPTEIRNSFNELLEDIQREDS